MDVSIEKILLSNYTDDTFNTHVSLIQPKGKFRFDRKDLEKFMDLYCTTIYNDPSKIIGIAEKPQQYLPVLADIDLKVEEELLESLEYRYGEHLYSELHLTQIINAYQKVLKTILDDCKNEMLLCVVLEKPISIIKSGESRIIKNGLHLHFPNVFLSKSDQEVHLIPRVQEELKIMEVFSDMGIEDSGSVIDKACCKVPWLMYGSRKDETKDPYIVTKVINYKNQQVDLEAAFKHYRIYDMNEKLIKIENVKKELPRILSIIPRCRDICELRHGLPIPSKEQLLSKSSIKDKKFNSNLSESDIEKNLDITEKLIPMIADYRAEERNEWISIGWALHSVSNGNLRGLEQWIEFSKRCEEKFDEAVCISEWTKMTRHDYSIGTIRYYASIDSPKEYAEYKKEQIENHVKDALNGSHYDIARILHDEYGTHFVCSSIIGKTWYQFTGNFWEEIEDGVFLREKISEDVISRFKVIAQDCLQKLLESDDKSDLAKYNEKLKIVKRLIQNLKSAPFKNNVMREALDIFYDKKFKSRLDQNPYLIGFKNGVYDLNQNVFRAGRPEDYISKHLPINYKEFDEKDEDVAMVKDFLEKVFPDTDVRQFFLDNASDLFVGGNNQKTIIFWTGCGDNGKSVTQQLVEGMLGELSVKFPTTLFSQKKLGNGAADPTLARAAPPVRLATLEEPDNDEALNIGLIKSLTGNDSYFARDLFEAGKKVKEVTPMFKIYFITNKLPKLKHSDQALWNRVLVLPFESVFVRPGNPCPETYEEQLRQKRFPMDINFKNKIVDLYEPFAWYLLKHRQNVTIRVHPAKVLEATAIYQRQNDIYRQFVEESIIECKNSKIKLDEIYIIFKDWCKEAFSTYTVPSKNDVKESFIKLWGEPIRNIWSGYKFGKYDDDETEILDMNDLM